MEKEVFFKILGFSFLVSIIMIRVVAYLWLRPRKIEEHFAKQGIRGPPYKFFIGNAKEIVSLMLKASSQTMPYSSHNILPRVLSFYHHWKKIYGATFLVWFGPTPRLAVADPDLIREIFTTKSEFYEKNEAHPLIRQLEGDGLLSLKGEKWAHHRKIITPTFHMENLKLLIPGAASKVIEMLEKLTQNSKNGGIEIEVSEWFQTLTEDIVAQTAFGRSYEQGKAIFRLQAQQMVLASEAFQKVFIPGYRFLPTRRNIKSWKLDTEIKKSLMKLIQERTEDWGKEMQENGPKDLLGLMIQASMKESSLSSSINSPLNHNSAINSSMITANDIAEECKTFFFAGEQTTSNLLTWTTVLLAMHPQWQDLARDEVIKVCGSRDIPSKDDLAKLKMLSMILNESLRLYPPIVATIRRAKADVDLGGCKIPLGTEVLIPILAVHHDQAIWGNDANEFNPARFSEGVARAAKHPVAYIPFGLGVRQCIGQNLAILQTKLTLAIILQRFTLRLSPQYKHAPTVLMLLHPQYGAPIIFQQRLSNPTIVKSS
ncbi:cytochrome P450 734A1 [Nicotiana tabacum]|uniref:Cytochrome P450 734A1 n=2 Tax=Nicotiana TaxID=4085 RepID=A0A1S4D9A6_TOBAC|nr:PREDICTED: cytochrome P450 734A1-like [Nicotiana sylvestris]XP_009797712.1 PREDICTED: cytochrome P450 734A1-like [Nicotiana sylvestris]XP_016509966.1 PREDICTED: cytochrome P450 734A1-like [Nicotiana tabacum]